MVSSHIARYREVQHSPLGGKRGLSPGLMPPASITVRRGGAGSPWWPLSGPERGAEARCRLPGQPRLEAVERAGPGRLRRERLRGALRLLAPEMLAQGGQRSIK